MESFPHVSTKTSPSTGLGCSFLNVAASSSTSLVAVSDPDPGDPVFSQSQLFQSTRTVRAHAKRQAINTKRNWVCPFWASL